MSEANTESAPAAAPAAGGYTIKPATTGGLLSGDQVEGLTDDEKLWGMLAHLLFLLSMVLPFGNFIGPAIAYFTRKESKFVRFHAIQMLALQVCLLAVTIPLVALLIFCMLIPPLLLLFIPVALLLMVVGLALTVYCILVGVKANQGLLVTYPLVGAWAKRKVFEEDWKPV